MAAEDLAAFVESFKGYDKFGNRALKILADEEVTELRQLKRCCVATIGRVGAMSAGLDGFLSTIVDEYKERCQAELDAKKAAQEVPRARADQYSRSVCEEELEHWKAVAATFGKPEKEKQKVHIDLGATIPKLNLETLPQTCWPQSALVDALATEAKSRTNDGKVPCIYQQLEKYLPSWCKVVGAEVVVETETDEDKKLWGNGFEALAKRLGAEDKKQKKLDPLRWSVAYDRYALAAAATGQLSLGAAMAHKNTCLSLGAAVGQRTLGVTYDELVRRSWAERSVCGDVKFDIEVAALTLDEGCLKEAKAALESAGAQSNQQQNGARGNSKQWQQRSEAAGSKGGLTCFVCGKEGHKARDCRENSGDKGRGKAAKGSGKKRDFSGKPVNRG